MYMYPSTPVKIVAILKIDYRFIINLPCVISIWLGFNLFYQKHMC